MLGSVVLVAAVTAQPGRWSARRVAAIYLGCALLAAVLVGPATDALVLAEGLSYRRGGDVRLPAVILLWPLAPLLAAFLLDRFALRRRTAAGALPWDRELVWRSAVCVLPIPLVITEGLPRLFTMSGLLGGLIALALGVGGAWAGSRLGHNMGTVLRGLVR